MGASKSISAYVDIEAVFDTIRRHGIYPAAYECKSKSEAARWRQRANSYRVVLRRLEEDRLGLAKGQGTSIYDDLVFRVSPTNASVILIDQRKNEGVLIIGQTKVEPVPNSVIETEYPGGNAGDLDDYDPDGLV